MCSSQVRVCSSRVQVCESSASVPESVGVFECLLMRVYVHISMCVCECVCAGVQASSMKFENTLVEKV